MSVAEVISRGTFTFNPHIGSDITDVADAMQLISDRLFVEVRCSFNGCDLVTGPAQRATKIVQAYHHWLQGPPEGTAKRT